MASNTIFSNHTIYVVNVVLIWPVQAVLWP